jgi:formiminotetrahydrofolate cyclodeaminase
VEQAADELTVGAFLDRLASSSPTPGGGAAAALTGAIGAALVAMVCNLTIGRPRYAAVESTMQAALAASERARSRLLDLAREDEVAYGAVDAAYRLPRADDAERAARSAAIQAALQGALAPPLETARVCREVLGLALQAAAHGNVNLVSDAGVAAVAAEAGVRAAILNVRVNLSQIRDPAFVASQDAAIAAIEAGLADDLDRVAGIVRAKLAPKAAR